MLPGWSLTTSRAIVDARRMSAPGRRAIAARDRTRLTALSISEDASGPGNGSPGASAVLAPAITPRRGAR